MLRVPITQARPGMILAMPIRHPEARDRVLLHAGYKLCAAAVDRLHEIELRELWIRYPSLEFVGQYISPDVLERQAEMTDAISEVFDAVSKQSHAELNYADYKRMIREFLETLVDNPTAALFIQEMAGVNQPMLRHSSNVCFLSLLMGLKLEGYLVRERKRLPSHLAKNVVNLGIGAMMHDVGMLRLSEQTIDRWNKRQNESDEHWRRHVEYGYEMVRGHLEPSAAATVLHHHQRFDGLGFPEREDGFGNMRGLEGHAIHIFPRIVAIADLFDRLRNPPDSTAQRPVVRVLRLLQMPELAKRIDPMVFKALLAVAPAYAPGSLVKLSNGENAVVAQWFPEDPCRPIVQVLGDVEREHSLSSAQGPRHDLRERTDLRIVESEGQNVSRDNFYPKFRGQFDVRAAERALWNRAAESSFEAA